MLYFSLTAPLSEYKTQGRINLSFEGFFSFKLLAGVTERNEHPRTLTVFFALGWGTGLSNGKSKLIIEKEVAYISPMYFRAKTCSWETARSICDLPNGVV